MTKKHKPKKWLYFLLSLLPIGASITGGLIYYKQSQKQPQTPVNNPVFDKANTSVIEDYTLPKNHQRILHWNILNYGGAKHTQNSFKVNALSQILIHSNASIMGLTEVNYTDGDKVARIVKAMNQIKPNTYNYVIQDQKQALSKLYPASKELVAIIYNQKLVKPIAFKNNKSGDSFINTFKLQLKDNQITLSNVKDEYVRPLYGHEFEYLDNKKHITTVFGHLDSPLASKNETLINGKIENKYPVSNVGNKELQEALNLRYAMAYFSSISHSHNVIFGGDTNIAPSSASVFDYLTNFDNLQTYYPYQEAGKQKYLTSLTTIQSKEKNPKKYPYVNSYDKWLFKEDTIDFLDGKENPDFSYKIDISQVFNNKMLDKNTFKKLYLTDYNKSTNPADKNPSDFRMIRNAISDHAPIMIDFVLK